MSRLRLPGWRARTVVLAVVPSKVVNAVPNVLGSVRVAAGRPRQAHLRHESGRPAAPAHAGRGRVEGLDAVRVESGSGSSRSAPDRAAAGAQRVWHEWVGDDRQAALLVDLADVSAQSLHGRMRCSMNSATTWPPRRA